MAANSKQLDVGIVGGSSPNVPIGCDDSLGHNSAASAMTVETNASDATLPSLSSSLLNSVQSEVEMMANTSADTDLIEEAKEVFPGIRVRAAKLHKLIEILIDSFGTFFILYLDVFFRIGNLISWIFEDENGNVNKNTDFPRVFLLMHMWFMESVGLAETLYELYQKNEDHQPQHPIAYRLRICHVLKYNKFFTFIWF